MELQESKHASASEGSTRKVYQKPCLEVYGDLGMITQSIGTTGAVDAGSDGMKMATTAA
jgi:hypothetical protein